MSVRMISARRPTMWDKLLASITRLWSKPNRTRRVPLGRCVSASSAPAEPDRYTITLAIEGDRPSLGELVLLFGADLEIEIAD